MNLINNPKRTERDFGGDSKRRKRFTENFKKIKAKNMKDQDIVKIFLDTEEWQTFECKRAAIRPADLLEVVVAFANSDGGFIVGET